MGNSIPSLKLTYFDIEGVAEQIRLTLKVQGIPFEDERISFDEWPQMKAKTRFGQLPVLSIDGGPPVSQSGAILRLCARLKSNYNLYPIEPEKMLRIEEVLGLVSDFDKSLAPSVFMAMRPEAYGYASGFAGTVAGKTAIRDLRRKWLENDFQKFMSFYSNLLAGGGYLTGKSMTVADIAAYASLRKVTKGTLDGVPPSSIDTYPEVLKWIRRMEGTPAIYGHYYSMQSYHREERERAILSGAAADVKESSGSIGLKSAMSVEAEPISAEAK